MSSSPEVFECAVCLDECLNPVRLECNHIFCYLCVKGWAKQWANRCPVCRQHIHHNYFESPVLVDGIHVSQEDQPMRWQYEGRNGWWIYDCRTTKDIEKAFDANESTTEVLIAGFVYVIDFERMIQYRRNEPNRMRQIRRQPLDPNTTKGVAGLRTQFSVHQNQTIESSDQNIDSNESHCSQRDTNSSVSDQNVTQIDVNEDNDNTSDSHRVVTSDTDEEVLRLEEILRTGLTLNDGQRETYL